MNSSVAPSLEISYFSLEITNDCPVYPRLTSLKTMSYCVAMCLKQPDLPLSIIVSPIHVHRCLRTASNFDKLLVINFVIRMCVKSDEIFKHLHTGAARVGVWVLRWTHTFYLEDQNFNI